MECIYPVIKNCRLDNKCPDGYECCSENVPAGGKQKLGLCVRTDECDKTRGIPKRSCRDENYRQTFENRVERFTVRSSEGYSNNDCTQWNRAFWTMFIVMCLVIFLILSWRFRTVRGK